MTAGNTKIAQEKRTIEMMLRIYCQGHHGTEKELCTDCRKLLDYAHRRLDHCKFGEKKSTCGKCKTHCYKPDMREKIIEVMKYSGPRMIFIHPVAAVRHLLDSRKSQ